MIEYTGNVIIGSGGLDMLIPTNGTLLILQQTMWQGLQGFQRQPDSEVSIMCFIRRDIWRGLK
jgi:carboxypeptidase D